ncbi:LYSM4-like protein [Mya arenaria]|uniref:LYSM4-like protein n=1 Tax=Mya arenaria TaxID=6604 RepID=A0ABY7DT78_MYAAR|nr:lysM and putative peptidoglycan-binding domain-containing protein 3-like [Mya arenaria]WAR00903.1 LYSM4-like protein [Mya arenaria]
MTGKNVKRLFKGKDNYTYTRLGQSLGQVQNVKNARVFVFGDDDVEEDERNDVVEFDMQTIRGRKGAKSQVDEDPGGPLFVERNLAEDDTLQSLSLQYGCPISELKRINNLIQDQDFFALTRIKIPVKKHSFLIDRIKDDDQKVNSIRKKETSLSNGATCYNSFYDNGSLPDDSSTPTDSEAQTDLSDPENQRDFVKRISINRTSRGQSREAQNFLRKMDQDISNIVKSARTERGSLDEVISVLTNKSVSPMILPDKPKSLFEIQCGERWKYYIVLLIVTVIAIPVVFGLSLYYKGKLW